MFEPKHARVALNQQESNCSDGDGHSEGPEGEGGAAGRALRSAGAGGARHHPQQQRPRERSLQEEGAAAHGKGGGENLGAKVREPDPPGCHGEHLKQARKHQPVPDLRMAKEHVVLPLVQSQSVQPPERALEVKVARELRVVHPRRRHQLGQHLLLRRAAREVPVRRLHQHPRARMEEQRHHPREACEVAPRICSGGGIRAQVHQPPVGHSPNHRAHHHRELPQGGVELGLARGRQVRRVVQRHPYAHHPGGDARKEPPHKQIHRIVRQRQKHWAHKSQQADDHQRAFAAQQIHYTTIE
mmetsp:Transcript_5628/g.10749  ORF Transcript_5628/g.10749 Transcript_5628/m.10749 type:complete len:299 (+) Transcript_5628:2683-3579(+)